MMGNQTKECSMAEAMELDLTLNDPDGKSLKNPILEHLKNEKKISSVPKNYSIDEYYKNDDLGSDVLKQKYLAPWEKHPFELWKRQAKALASVEKNKKLKDEGK